MTLAARIRSERERMGLTQRQAAELIGTSEGSYRALETRPNNQPRPLTRAALVRAGWRLHDDTEEGE